MLLIYFMIFDSGAAVLLFVYQEMCQLVKMRKKINLTN